MKEDHLCGYVVWMQQPRDDKGHLAVDTENPDAQKQGRKLLGHQMILGLAHDGNVYRGQIYNADNGKSYDVQIWSDDPAEMTVKGCMFKLLCSSQGWKRVTDLKPGQLVGATDGADGPQADHEWARAVVARQSSKDTKAVSVGSTPR